MRNKYPLYVYMNQINIIDEASKFIITNFDNIVLVFLFMVIGLIYVVMNNVSFHEEERNKKTTTIVTYETFENKDTCETLEGQGNKIEEYCATLHPKLCKHKSCCILGKMDDSETMKCVSGSKMGPTYHTMDDGTDINFDYYYYQGKCYGESCPNEE